MKRSFILLIVLLTSFVILNSCREDIASPPETTVQGSEINTNLKEITQPSEAELWVPGYTYTIKWKVNDNYDHVNISLVRKFNHIMMISNSTTNDGSFQWKVPTNIPHSHHYRIKLTSQPGTSASVHSEEFYILGSQ
jgi:hypothetical protein